MSRVLLVSHDAHVRSELRLLIDEMGWQMQAMVSVEETWTHQTDMLDVVILDMCHVDGSAVLEEIRHHHPAAEIVLFSERSTGDVVDQLTVLKITHYFTFPRGDLAQTRLLLRNAAHKAQMHRAHKATEQRLTSFSEISDLTSRATNDGLWDWDLEHNTINFSQRWLEMLGHETGEVSNAPTEWFDRVHPEERDQLREELVVHIDHLTDHFRSEHRIRHKSGDYRWVIARGLAQRRADGKAIRLVGSHTDITAQKLTEERLVHDSFHDALTGLPNNALLRERLERAANYAKRRPGYTFAVLFLDVDRFKNVNDSLGHVEGDQLLIIIAGRLKSCIRSVDLAARLGGDEFILLLDDIADKQEAVYAAERIQRAVAMPFYLNGQEIYASTSIGIAISSDPERDPYSLVRDADTAMYRAKSRGSGLYEIFNPSMHAQAVQLLGMETSLRRAISRDELRLHYQPIVNLMTGEIAGFEALLRWYSSDKGIVQPQDFIPVAEETGLIIPIGRWALREACRQMVAWQQNVVFEKKLFMSVNISPRQFTQVDLVDQIAAVLDETRIAPEVLKLEITESVLIDNVESTAVMMRRLQSMNVRLCIDDFGTGYSSLSTLSQLPIHTLKIDRSFVHQTRSDGKHAEIVDTIIMLAHNLTMDVIAEGIENEEQLRILKARNCEYGQGYLFSRPITADAAAALIKSVPPWFDSTLP